jgi:hypothetical protein
MVTPLPPEGGFVVMRLVMALTGVAVLVPGPALAGVSASSPTAGSVVPGAPPVVTLTMGRAVGTATVLVTDGCGEEVPSDVRVVGTRVSVRLAVGHAAAGHPDHTSAAGTWRVAWHTADDTGDVLFTVAGESRCGRPAPASPPRADNPWFLRILLAVAGAGILLTLLRLWQRRSSPTPVEEH